LHPRPLPSAGRRRSALRKAEQPRLPIFTGNLTRLSLHAHQLSPVTLLLDTSLAITIQELFAFGVVPFSETCPSNLAVLSAILTEKRPPCPPACPQGVWQYVNELWAQSPDDRPVIADVVDAFEKLLAGEVQSDEPDEQYYSFASVRE
jgi:Protein tyrosine and serine/threonine kinase